MFDVLGGVDVVEGGGGGGLLDPEGGVLVLLGAGAGAELELPVVTAIVNFCPWSQWPGKRQMK